MGSRSDPWTRLADRGTRRTLETVRALVADAAPGAAETRVDAERGRGEIVVRGPGSRRLPGKRIDRREHRLSAAYDGNWLQLAYRVDDDLVDAETLFRPAAGETKPIEAFFARHLPRVRWKNREGLVDDEGPAVATPNPPATATERASPRAGRSRQDRRPRGVGTRASRRSRRAAGR